MPEKQVPRRSVICRQDPEQTCWHPTYVLECSQDLISGKVWSFSFKASGLQISRQVSEPEEARFLLTCLNRHSKFLVFGPDALHLGVLTWDQHSLEPRAWAQGAKDLSYSV